MTGKAARVLLIGYGNPGRLDDGLGPRFAQAMENLGLDGLTVESNYQLNVEDASQVAEHDVVIFADASVDANEPFEFKKLEPKKALGFSSHSVDPEVVLWLSDELFKAKSKGFVVAIRGYEFNEFGERLSDKAENNLQKAVDFVSKVIKNKDFDLV